MSGAEAILVLGVISSVISIVEGAKQVYDAAEKGEGLPEAFREVAERLPIVRTILASAEKHISDGDVDDDSCKALQPVIERCGKKAETLDKLFKKVLPPNDATRAERYLKAVRTLGKGGKVEALMRGMLEDVQLLACNYGMKTVTTDQIEQVAKALREVSHIKTSVPDSEFHDAAVTTNMLGDVHGTQNINNVEGDQYLATGSAKMYNATSMSFEMKDPNFHAQTQNFISSSAFRTSMRLQDASEEAILDLLAFREMDERYEDIAEAHAETFCWIYESPEVKFLEWLQKGHGIYWINGKAGCGKSTLMKYLYKNPRTRQNVPSDIERVCIAGFFFHDRGPHPLLKSQEGLFRAILHRILSEYRQLISVVLPSQFATLTKRFKNGTDRVNDGWTLSELKAAFRAMVNQKVLSLRLCLLIDGLDEFSGEHKTIIAALDELVHPSSDSVVKVQLCLSSRPLLAFENAYFEQPQLKVQDLTAGDIKRYVTDEFNKDAHLKELATNDIVTSNQIMEEILEKAEGVFLWVTLVVNSLIEGLEGGDDMKDLQRRLSELPAGLEPLYQRMVEYIQPRYREQAAELFRIVKIATSPLTPLALSFVDEDPKHALSVKHEVLSDEKIKRRHILVSKRLKSRCAGLIEISVRSYGNQQWSWPGEELSDTSVEGFSGFWTGHKVQFLHLTVKEFLSSAKMKTWLATRPSTNISNFSQDEIANSQVGSSHVRILICGIRQLQATACAQLHDSWAEGKKKPTLYFDDKELSRAFQRSGVIDLIFFHALQAEKHLHKSQLIYLEALDKLMQDSVVSKLKREKSTKKQPPPHWTTFRYNNWHEPDEWQSDYVSYLVTIGMTRAVIEKIHGDYDPLLKPGRPLLHYAISSITPAGYTIDVTERDVIDPEIVEELLKKGCHPNQPLEPRELSTTIWEDTLLHCWRRFCAHYPENEADYDPDNEADYYTQLYEQEAAMNHLRKRWVKTFRLFIESGADVNVTVTAGDYYAGSHYAGEQHYFKMSTLSIFNDAFAEFNHDLVQSTRDLLIQKGGVVLKERISRKDTGIRYPVLSEQGNPNRGSTFRLACCCNPS